MDHVYRRKGLFDRKMTQRTSGEIDEMQLLTTHQLIAERIRQLERVQAQRDVRLLGGEEHQVEEDQT